MTEVILSHLAGWGVQVSGEVVACHHGDDHVVNCLEQHPQLPLVLATSGDGTNQNRETPCLLVKGCQNFGSFGTYK